jgi:hypothetical protein
MRTVNAIMRVARRFWPGAHHRYREDCALAVIGELDAPEMSRLNRHIAYCETCRSFLESTAQVSVQVLPMLADGRMPKAEVIPPTGIRARFLARTAAEGLNVRSDLPYLSLSPVSKPVDSMLSEARITTQRALQQSRTAYPLNASTVRWVAVAAAILAVGLAGYFGGRRQGLSERSAVSPRVASDSYNGSARKPVNNVAGGAIEQRQAALESESRELNLRLSEATAQNRSLEDDLSASMQKLTDATAQVTQDQRRTNQEKQDALNKVSSLQQEVDKLRWKLIDSDAALSAQKTQSEDLRAKLEAADSELQREDELKSAGGQINDLVAARNLHIIDVYDADKGLRQHSFGRVFYVEGKSLVFYVYDLQDPHRLTTNVVFRVWGEKSGMKETTHNLGILHNEDVSQGRWTLTFDDAKVLAQINSVFVTVEPANRDYGTPHGKKLLYAYFGSTPNHP